MIELEVERGAEVNILAVNFLDLVSCFCHWLRMQLVQTRHQRFEEQKTAFDKASNHPFSQLHVVALVGSQSHIQIENRSRPV